MTHMVQNTTLGVASMDKFQTKAGTATVGNIGKLDEQLSTDQVKYFLHHFLGLTGMEVSVTAYPRNHAFHLFTHTKRMKNFI